MTATPIPRTLALTLYGDLDVSVIDELPPGRKPIQTEHYYDGNHTSVYALLDRELKKGRQAYIVYPLIEESEKIDLKNLEDGYLTICDRFSGYSVGKVHGRMKSAEKDAEMQRFKRAETQIMVATTVIEVGVDVPNASIMVIENANRFGLSQLHQLRGRVGRGADQSFCLLVTPYQLSEDTRKRIEIMTATCDGFEIAEADLKLRGPGDLEGTQQSGIVFDLRLANLARDGVLIERCRELAREIIAKDPQLTSKENRLMGRILKRLKKSPFDWSYIS
jgi:ATP-dependent DNA helicase RecG